MNNEATLSVVEALEASDIPYMLVGSYSSNAYGVARATQDADFVIELGDTSLGELGRRLAPSIRIDPQMSFETVTMTRRYVAEVVGTPFRIEFFLLNDDPHNQERFRRRRQASLMGRQIWIPTAEDVIITKLHLALLASRSKDRDDIRDVIAVQGGRIDWDYVHRWCEEHGTRALAAGRDPGVDPADLMPGRHSFTLATEVPDEAREGGGHPPDPLAPR